MKKKQVSSSQVVFQPALTPLEAAMLPARDRSSRGALHQAQRAFDPWAQTRRDGRAQRQKIWVR